MQCIGRGTRIKSQPFQEKYKVNNAKILDFVDNSGKHNLINTWTLDRDKSAKEKTFVTKENKEKLVLAERKRREARIDSNIKQDGRINLLKLPELKVYGGEWTVDMATEKQLDYLKKLGLWEPDVEYTKGMCSELISNESAQSWQLKKLSEWGYDVSKGCLNGQFQKIKQKMLSDHKYDPNFKI
jgi:type I site-specific restriction endonuclease